MLLKSVVGTKKPKFFSANSANIYIEYVEIFAWHTYLISTECGKIYIAGELRLNLQ